MARRLPIILFDVMDTLVTEPFFTTVPAFFEMTFEQFLAAKHPTAWIDFEKGSLSEDEYFECFFGDGRRFDRNALVNRLYETYCWVNGMEGILSDLKNAGFQIHALSNYSVWYRLIEAKLELSRYLDWSFVSCETGVRKPDRRAFAHAVDRLGAQPGHCLFIDDRTTNVEAAEAFGIPSIVFCGAKHLRQELSERGIMLDE